MQRQRKTNTGVNVAMPFMLRSLRSVVLSSIGWCARTFTVFERSMVVPLLVRQLCEIKIIGARVDERLGKMTSDTTRVIFVRVICLFCHLMLALSMMRLWIPCSFAASGDHEYHKAR